MFGYLIFAVAFIGTSYAAYLDIKTTEVPDRISYGVAAVSLVLHFGASYVAGNWQLLFSSVVAGLGFFALGLILYFLGVWGGADAFVLGSVGFAFPYLPEVFSPVFVAPWPFPLTILFNVMVVGLVYSLLFALYAGIRSETVMKSFAEDLRAYWRRAAVIVLGYMALIGVLTASFAGVNHLFSLQALRIIGGHTVLLLGLLFLYRYLQAVETDGMRETVAVEELEPGDVIEETVDVDGEVMQHQGLLGAFLERLRHWIAAWSSRLPDTMAGRTGQLQDALERLERRYGYPDIVGLTEEEVEAIRSSRETVTVKEGVRFVPSFPAAILVSVSVGDLLYAFIMYLV